MRADVELLERRTVHGVELAEERARAVAVSEVDIRLGQAMAILEERVVRRAESHVLGLVKSLLEENRRQWQRQLMELQHLVEERLEQRLRETIVVAKKAAEAQAREVIVANAETGSGG